MAQKALTLTNDTAGYRSITRHYPYSVAGNLTAATAAPVFTAAVPGTVANLLFSVLTYPTSTDRTVTVTLKKVSGTVTTALCTTNPSLSFAASGTGSFNTSVAATGIVPAVLDPTKWHLNAGDQVTLDLTLAGTNGTLGTGISVDVAFIPDAA